MKNPNLDQWDNIKKLYTTYSNNETNGFEFEWDNITEEWINTKKWHLEYNTEHLEKTKWYEKLINDDWVTENYIEIYYDSYENDTLRIIKYRRNNELQFDSKTIHRYNLTYQYLSNMELKWSLEKEK